MISVLTKCFKIYLQMKGVDGRSEDSVKEILDNMVVENLAHIDQNSIFDGM